MVRTVLSLLVTLLLAAMLAWLSKWGQEAVVSFFVRQTRIDLSLNLFLVLSLLVFAFLYVLVRGLGLLTHLPEKAQAWRAAQAQRSAYQHFKEASLHFLSGRYLKVNGELQALFNHPPNAPIARLMAAQAAHEIRNYDERDDHVTALEAHVKNLPNKTERQSWNDILALRRAHWALRALAPNEALTYLSQLSPAGSRKVLSLRAKLKAAQMAGQTQMALDTARLLARHGAFSNSVARSLLHSLMQTLIKQSKDSAELMTIWRSWNAHDRSDALLCCSFADQLHRFGQQAHDHEKSQYSQWARKALLPISQRYPALSEPIKEVWVGSLHRHWLGIDAANIALIEQIQQTHPADPLLQFLLGSLTHHLGLWGKAESLLKLAVKSPQLPASLRALAWRLLAELAERQGDPIQTKQALQQALNTLDTLTR